MRETEVSIGGIHGRLLEHGEHAPNLVIISGGSGPIDMDGNTAVCTADTLKILANLLATQHVSVFSYNKCGALGNDWSPYESSVNIWTYVANLLMFANYFKNKFCNIYFCGHSEGGIVSIVASCFFKCEGLICINTPGRPMGALLKEQLRNNLGISDENIDLGISIIDSISSGDEVQKELPDFMANLFRNTLHNYYGSVFCLDPCFFLSKFSRRSLLIQGERDLQVSIDDAQHLFNASKFGEKVLFPKMNHTLRDVADDFKANIDAYCDSSLPLTAGLAPCLGSFLLNQSVLSERSYADLPYNN